MRTIKIAMFSLMLSFSFFANAESNKTFQTEKDMYEECSADSQAGMKDCLAKKASQSEKALKDSIVKVKDSLPKWDEDEKYINFAKSKFAESNKDFTKYRQTQCAFLTSMSGGGAGDAGEMGRLDCTAMINNQRIEQLRDAMSKLPLK